jgi:hypothetical protein
VEARVLWDGAHTCACARPLSRRSIELAAALGGRLSAGHDPDAGRTRRTAPLLLALRALRPPPPPPPPRHPQATSDKRPSGCSTLYFGCLCFAPPYAAAPRCCALRAGSLRAAAAATHTHIVHK